MKKDKSKYLFFSIFAFVGLGLLIGGVIVTISHAKYMKTAEPIVAVISDIESYRGAKGKSHYNVYVDYQYDGVMYEHIELNYYSTGMRRG